MSNICGSRYNDHPNVRTRDTKQLRKAWENLKYRARKLGGDIKRNGPRTTKNMRGSASDKNDCTHWPLDGINFPPTEKKDHLMVENPDGDFEEDSRSVTIEEELNESSLVEEGQKRIKVKDE